MSFLEKELLSKQDDIIKAIFETLLPYSSLDKEEFFQKIQETIHSTIFFVRNSYPIKVELSNKQKYQKIALKFEQKLSELTSISHSIDFDRDSIIITNFNHELESNNFNEYTQSKDIYMRYERTFKDLNASFPLLMWIYKNKGEYVFKSYIKELFKLESKVSSYEFNQELLRSNISLKKTPDLSNIDKLINMYKLKNIYELKDFYDNLKSILLEKNFFNPSQENLKKTTTHLSTVLNKNPLEESDILNAIRTIAPILKNKNIYQLLYCEKTKEDVISFSNQYNLKNLSTNDYYKIFKAFTVLSLNGTGGVSEFIQDKNFIGVKTNISSYDNATQVGIIIHEYMHSLEFLHRKEFEYFRKNYRQINEVLTEYLSRKAADLYLPNTIFSIRDDSKETIYAYENYYYKIKPLMKSDIFNQLLSFKVNGNIETLEANLGKQTLKKICDFLSYPDNIIGENMMKKLVNKYNQKQLSRL